jgi:hypothetical protein
MYEDSGELSPTVRRILKSVVCVIGRAKSVTRRWKQQLEGAGQEGAAGTGKLPLDVRLTVTSLREA